MTICNLRVLLKIYLNKNFVSTYENLIQPKREKNLGKIYLCLTCTTLLLTAPQLGHIRNTVLTTRLL